MSVYIYSGRHAWICMYADMYVCMYVCMHACMCTCIIHGSMHIDISCR